MPQLDLVSFLPQYVWGYFIISYMIGINTQFSTVLGFQLKIREKYSSYSFNTKNQYSESSVSSSHHNFDSRKELIKVIYSYIQNLRPSILFNYFHFFLRAKKTLNSFINNFTKNFVYNFSSKNLSVFLCFKIYKTYSPVFVHQNQNTPLNPILQDQNVSSSSENELKDKKIVSSSKSDSDFDSIENKKSSKDTLKKSKKKSGIKKK